MREIDPNWWRSGEFEGRPLRSILRAQDVSTIFRFLRSRGWSRSAIAGATELTESRVREIIHGRRQVTTYLVLERIAGGLCIDRSLMGLGFDESDVRPGKDEPVALTSARVLSTRRTAQDAGRVLEPSMDPDFIGAMAALAVGSTPAALSRLLPTPAAAATGPTIVSGEHVAVLREMTEQHRQLDAAQGGGVARDSAAGYLRWAEGLRQGRFDSTEAHRSYLAALSDLHQVVGWASHDSGDHASARRHLTAGLALAREVDDLLLACGALYRLGRVSIHQGRPLEALRLWQLGQIVAQDSGDLLPVAVLHANEAWAYAQLGAADHVRDALARARGELERVDVDSAPGWARFFVAPADLSGISGVIYGCLAAHTDHRKTFAPMAIECAEYAFQTRRPGESRSKTFDAIALAAGYALDRQPREVETAGHIAVEMAQASASARAADRLDQFAELARPLARRSGVRDVLTRIRALRGR